MDEHSGKVKILVIHGPNLNLLGIRETHLYGSFTLEDVNKMLREIASQAGVEIEIFQSNSESEIVTKIQNAKDWADAILINPAAFTHYSIAIRDAILAVNKPTVEVHITNIYKREKFRRRSVISDIAVGVISGFGIDSYRLGLLAAINLAKKRNISTTLDNSNEIQLIQLHI
jgi:3-dehydroquinate dehydratase-2